MNNLSNLEVQLCELEMLMSMFPGEHEMIFDDPSELADLRTSVRCDIDSATSASTEHVTFSNSLGFTLQLTVEEHLVELSCRLPRSYPPAVPTACLRVPALTNAQQRQIATELYSFMQDHLVTDPSAGILLDIVSWINDNVPAYASSNTNFESPLASQSAPSSSPAEEFTRLWIYSHHIYNTTKRRTILNLAHDLELSGFCAPGKPGIICVEGRRLNTETFWQQVRSMQWQRITLVHREDASAEQLSKLSELRRFVDFTEQCFESHGCGHGTHMDRSQLFKYLTDHKSAELFKLIFGVGGKSSDCC